LLIAHSSLSLADCQLDRGETSPSEVAALNDFIQAASASQITLLDLSNCRVPLRFLTAVSLEALRASHFQYLLLRSAFLSLSVASAFAHALPDSLLHLDLSDCDLESEHLSHLLPRLISLPLLRSLDLSENPLST
jgi:hypothetical protein